MSAFYKMIDDQTDKHMRKIQILSVRNWKKSTITSIHHLFVIVDVYYFEKKNRFKTVDYLI